MWAGDPRGSSRERGSRCQPLRPWRGRVTWRAPERAPRRFVSLGGRCARARGALGAYVPTDRARRGGAGLEGAARGRRRPEVGQAQVGRAGGGGGSSGSATAPRQGAQAGEGPEGGVPGHPRSPRPNLARPGRAAAPGSILPARGLLRRGYRLAPRLRPRWSSAAFLCKEAGRPPRL